MYSLIWLFTDQFENQKSCEEKDVKWEKGACKIQIPTETLCVHSMPLNVDVKPDVMFFIDLLWKWYGNLWM